LANKKKKKQQQKKGGQRPTYAKGKKVAEEPKKKTSTTTRPAAAKAGSKPAAKAPGKPGSKQAQPPPGSQWNVIKSGTPELKIFEIIMIAIVLAALIQYPLWLVQANNNYTEQVKQYKIELKKFEQKYPTTADQQKHAKEKPATPKKMSFKDFLLYQAIYSALTAGIFAFLGLNVIRRTDLKTDILDAAVTGESWTDKLPDLGLWTLVGAAAALVPLTIGVLMDRLFAFGKDIKVINYVGYARWKEALYNAGNYGILQQMILMVLIFSVLVYVFTRYRKQVKIEPHWAAIAAATLLTFGYLMLLNRGVKTDLAIISSASAAIASITVLGYLFWRKGLEYSLLAGVVAFGLYPFIAGLIIGH
jgi:hypothetical protein